MTVFSSSTEWWTFQSHADLGTHFAHCTADRGVLTVTVLGMVVDSPVAVQRQGGMVQKDSYRGMCKAGLAGETVDFPQLPFFAGRRLPCRGASADSYVLTVQKNIEFPQLQSIDQVLDVPVAQFVLVPQVFLRV